MPEQQAPEGDDDAVLDVDAQALTTVTLDVLGPALAWWRIEAARRLGLDTTSFDCLDLLRRRGRVPCGTIGERTGLTRSSVSKLLRRLERAGHVDLFRSGEREQVFEARLRAHAERDAELARLHEELRFRLRYTASYGVDDRGRSAAVQLLRHSADALASATMASVDRAAETRRLEARRRRDAETGAVGW